MTTAPTTSAHDFALAAAELAANTRCENVVLLDMRGRSPVTEFFLIATGSSARQMRTVADELRELGQRMGFQAWHTSGYETARWILVDCVTVVAHVFDTASRDFYDLELLWGDAPRIDWRAALGLPAEAFTAEVSAEVSAEDQLSEAMDEDVAEAQREEARLEGRDEDGEAGDSDEEQDNDAPVVTELPDLTAGGDAVELVEIDPPNHRRERGKSVFPTPLRPQDERETERMRPLNEQSEDTDERERREERAADRDPEAIAAGDLPRGQIDLRPLGGVSAGISGGDILEDEDETARDSGDAEDSGQNRVEVPVAPTGGTAAIGAPGPVKPDGAKAGVVKAKAKTLRQAAANKAATKAVVRKTAVAKRTVKKPAVKKPAAKKTVARKTAGKGTVASKKAVKKPAAQKTAARKVTRKPKKKP